MIPLALYNESNLVTMSRLPDNSVDAIVTDPPYGLGTPPPIGDVLKAWLAGEVYHATGRGFMGKEWDAFVPGPEIWRECLRVLKPGGHLISFFGTRTYHLGTLAIQLAGFEVRDQLAWIYGSGFPKGQDISKAIDKVLGHEREVISTSNSGSGAQKNKLRNHTSGDTGIGYADGSGKEYDITAPSSPLAIKYDGWNTNLKPAIEPICLARKPLIGTVAANVMEHGTGGLNIDGCRIGEYGARNNGSKAADDGYQKNDIYGKRMPSERVDYEKGRYPANVLHDGSPEVLQFFPSAPGQLGPSRTTAGEKTNAIYGKMNHNSERMLPRQDESTSAARFFKKCEFSEDDLFFCNAKTIFVEWKKKFHLKHASVVELSSLLPRELVVSALNDAAILGSQGAIRLNDFQVHFTNVTLSELSNFCEILIGMMLSLDGDVLPDHWLDEKIKRGSLAKVVVAKEQIGTTTITISQQRLDGSVASVTLSTTKTNTGHGGLDLVNRFTYCAKASSSERGDFNDHPTVKPIDLMRWLVRLITPPGGVVYDPFSGSGSTLIAAFQEGFECIGSELDAHYCDIYEKRKLMFPRTQSLL